MAQRVKQPAMNGGRQFPPEAYEYNDDVTAEVVRKVREERGVDTSEKRWRMIDGLGKVIPA